MPYKQSLSYSKDLIKGTKIEIPKKKLILPFTGTATVKLYDALTGKQTYEAKSQNRISAVFGNMAYLDGFYYPILDNMQENILSDIYTTYPFRVMALTTGDIAEDSYDYFTWGSIIGYADGWYTYSGSDVLRGTVNKSETTRTDADASSTRHYVIDVPTSTANGTFKSIYWTGGASTQDTAQNPKINSLYPKIALETGTSSTSLPDYNLCTDETNFYALIKNTTTLVVYDKTTAVKKDNITLPVQAKAVAYDGTNFWLLISDGSFKRLDKSFTVVASYPKSAAVPDDLVYDVEYFDIAVNDVYVYITYNGCTDTSGSSSKYKSCIAKYNKDGTFASKTEIYTGSIGLITLTKITNNKLWAIKAVEEAKNMGYKILMELEGQQEDVNDKAYEFIREWAISNKNQFENDAKQRYGFLDGRTFYIFPSILEEALTKRNFSYRKTMRALGEKGLIGRSYTGNRVMYSVVKRYNNSTSRFIEIRFRELEIIKNRLQKAYSMTIKEQKKWSKKIKELEVLSAKLEKSTSKHFLDEEGVKLLISANKEISKELSEERWGDGIGKYFEENPEVNELLDKACSDIDYAFRIKSSTVLKLNLEKYEEAFKFVEKTYEDTKTLGIRELTPDESKKVDKDLEQIGWF